MKSAPRLFTNSLEAARKPDVITPSATTVAMPTAMPTTVRAVRIRCRKRFFTISAANVTLQRLAHPALRVVGSPAEPAYGESAGRSAATPMRWPARDSSIRAKGEAMTASQTLNQAHSARSPLHRFTVGEAMHRGVLAVRYRAPLLTGCGDDGEAPRALRRCAR